MPRARDKNRGRHSNPAVQANQIVQVDLENGRRSALSRTVQDIATVPGLRKGEEIKIGFTQIGGLWCRLKWLPHAQEWRIVDPAYRYKKVEFRVSGKRVYEVI